MARYIDADRIDYTVTMVGMDENAGYRAVAFESDIDAMPTADVVEAKHGYWIKRTTYPMGYNCSECNNSETYKSAFCRLCGAKMDGKPQKEV